MSLRSFRKPVIPEPVYDQPMQLRNKPCSNCPSTKGTCPETEQIMGLDEVQRKKSLFKCAWSNKLCRGYYNKMKFEEDYE